MTTKNNPAQIVSVQVGLPQTRIREVDGKPWRSAIGKSPVSGAVRIETENLVGDKQSNRKYHGGVDKAVCVYSGEHYPAWRTEFDRPEQGFGSFGENLTTQGLLESDVCLGDVYRLPSGATIQVCQPRVPCANVGHNWNAPDLPSRMMDTGHTGFYCRVLAEGDVTAGDALELTARPFPDWTMTRANRAYYGKKTDPAVIAERHTLLALGDPVSPECRVFVRQLLGIADE